MNSHYSSKTFSTRGIVTALMRWLLGALFIYMGLTKALHPEEFLKLMREYQIVQSPVILNSIAAALPWFEVFCGLLLVIGVAVRGSALMLMALLVAFIFAVLKRALVIHSTLGTPLCMIKFDCGCGMGEVQVCNKIAENCLLMLLCGWLLISRRGKYFCARYSLLRAA